MLFSKERGTLKGTQAYKTIDLKIPIIQLELKRMLYMEKETHRGYNITLEDKIEDIDQMSKGCGS